MLFSHKPSSPTATSGFHPSSTSPPSSPPVVVPFQFAAPVLLYIASATLGNSNTPLSYPMDPNNPSSLQPDSFCAPEGEYHWSPSHFLPTSMPSPVTAGTVPALPIKLSIVSVWYPPKRDGGLGSLLGMGGGAAKDDKSLSPLNLTSAMSSVNPQPQSPSQNSYEPSLSSSASEDPSSSDAATNSAASPPSSQPPDLSQSFASARFLGGGRPGGVQPHPRPKNNIRSTSSSFVTRIQSLEGLNKVLGERSKAGEEVNWAFWNYGRVLGWVEIGGKAKEPLARITFSVAITCHAVQQLTATPDRLDVFIGFVSGDLVWFDPLTGKYSRLNKSGVIHPSPVLSIIPHPTNPLLLYVLHQDGHVFHYSLERDDPSVSFTPPWSTYSLATDTQQQGPEDAAQAGMFIWRNNAPREGEKDKEKLKMVGKNPLAVWKVAVGTGANPATAVERKRPEKPSTAAGQAAAAHSMNGADGGKGLTNGKISPDGKMLALTGDDGGLRILDLAEERLTDVFTSYFGGLTCLSWSADSRFLLFGGQDDLITILSPRDQRIVARCQGHTSFVTALAWDKERCDSSKGRYRFGSVGEDGKVLLWDFSPASLHRPRHHHHTSIRRTSFSSTASFSHQLRRQSDVMSSSNLPLFSPGSTAGPRFHPAPPRAEVALLQAVMTKATDPSILMDIIFVNDSICTVSRNAQVRFWARPAAKVKSPLDGRGGLGIRRGPRSLGAAA